MDKLLIWGIGQFYDNYIAHYVMSGEINVVGFVTGVKTVCNFLDGIRIYELKDIVNIEFDYIVIANQSAYKEIRQRILIEFGISEEKCINGRVFKHPCFHWQRYKKIIGNKPTIIAEACYGGYIYNQLGIEFCSPFINTRIFERDYLRMLGNLEFYLSQNVCPRRDVQSVKDMEAKIAQKELGWGKMGYPIAQLLDIDLHAIHACNMDEYIAEWNRRRERINRKNIWIMMIIESDEMAEEFNKIATDNKIGFYFKETGYQNIVCLHDWENFSSRLSSGHDFLSYVHHLVWDETVLRYIDIFKLLCGEKDYIRLI